MTNSLPADLGSKVHNSVNLFLVKDMANKVSGLNVSLHELHSTVHSHRASVAHSKRSWF